MRAALWIAPLALLASSCAAPNRESLTCYKIVESVVTEQGERYIVPAPCPPDYQGPISG